MRFADYAYEHAKYHKYDRKRGDKLDQQARNAGFESTPDYIDYVQGHEVTRSFDGANGRTHWMNGEHILSGWNNREKLTQTTVITAASEKVFEAHKDKEAAKLSIPVHQIEEKGPLREEDRLIEPQQATTSTKTAESPDLRTPKNAPKDQEAVVETTGDTLDYGTDSGNWTREDLVLLNVLEDHESSGREQASDMLSQQVERASEVTDGLAIDGQGVNDGHDWSQHESQILGNLESRDSSEQAVGHTSKGHSQGK